MHTAARLGALGGKEESVISKEMLTTAGGVSYPISDARDVPLKGNPEPVEATLSTCVR